jgi:phosphatidylserine/phosphatidylglycerophosphate/cardiolipin synthase-like enzyme
VGNAVLLIGAILFPTALGYAVLGSARIYRWQAERRRAARSTVPPIERLCADLRRLNAQLTATENQMTLPGKGTRVRALRAAYVDALSAACRELEIAPPKAPSPENVTQIEIYRVEAALRERGVDVRRVATP